MRYYKKLVGKKCYLSPINADDVQQYTRWMNDLEVTSGLGNSGLPTSEVTEKEILLNLAKGHNYAIVDLETDELIGGCGFHKINHFERNGDVGIFIGDKSNWNKGYGTEAMTLLIGFGFDHLNLRNIMLKVFSFNENAIASYKKCGFKEIGRRRNSMVMKGHEYDDVYMDMLDTEYRKIYKKIIG